MKRLTDRGQRRYSDVIIRLAKMLAGFAGLGFLGYRQGRRLA
jgi:hypothetical protein